MRMPGSHLPSPARERFHLPGFSVYQGFGREPLASRHAAQPKTMTSPKPRTRENQGYEKTKTSQTFENGRSIPPELCRELASRDGPTAGKHLGTLRILV